MTGYLGYDPDLLANLARAMSDAEAELALFRSGDGEARHPLLTIAEVAHRLRDEWMPLVRGVLSCTALTGYRPATIDGSDLATSYLASVAARNRWRVVTDPTPASTVPIDLDRADALATWLNAHPDDVEDDELPLLGAQLAGIAAVPECASAFLARLDGPTLTRLVDRFGARHQDLSVRAAGGGLDDDQTETMTAIESIMTSIGGMIRHRAAPGVPPASDIVAGMEPYGAALLVARLGLGAAELAAVAASLIDREHHMLPSTAYMSGARAIDILLRAVLDTPGAPSRFVIASIDHPHFLLDATDGSLATRVLAAGTPPDVLSPEERITVIGPLFSAIIEAARSAEAVFTGTSSALDDIAAIVMTPYLLDVFVTDGNPLHFSHEDKERARAYFTEHPSVVRRLAEHRQRLQMGFDRPLGVDYWDDKETLTRLASLVALLDDLNAAAQIGAAERAQATWDLLWRCVGWAGSAASSMVTPVWAKVTTKVVSVGGRYVVEAAGFGPPDPHEIRADLLEDADARSAVLASIAVGSAFDNFVASGRLDPTVARPPVADLEGGNVGLRYIDALDEWVATVVPLDDDIARWVEMISLTILSPRQATIATIARFDEDDD
jgi:hypothetical protein